MISAHEADIVQISIHRSGQIAEQIPFVLSEAPFLITDDTLRQLLLSYFIRPFEQLAESYTFSHSSGELARNEVYAYVQEMFSDPDCFHARSQDLTRHLHHTSQHPRIKNGEFYVVRFQQLLVDGESREAIGLFKSEHKEPYIKVQATVAGAQVEYETEAINIRKLDKGCLILDEGAETGYRVLVTDLTNKQQEARYWMDEFLQLRLRHDFHSQTQAVLTLCKDFVEKGIDQEFEISKPEKLDLLQRSYQFFKKNDSFNQQVFEEEVIGHADGIRAFRQYRDQVMEDLPVEIPEEFPLSSAAVKQHARVYRSILKLDRNFHVYIHGNQNLIERGYDEARGKSFYKLYFDEERTG